VPGAEPLRAALVGLGWWGRTIFPLLEGNSKLEVVRRVDPYVDEPGIDKDYDAALGDSRVEAVILCTPHSLHCEQIVRAANSGKHVFCEKPLGLSRLEALRALEACNASKVALAVGHEKRFEPPVVELFRLLKAGELGTPLQVEANFSQDKFLSLAPGNWRASEKEAPAGPMTATGIHLLDLSVGVFGPAARVFASVKQLGSALANGDTLGVLVNFESGGNALLSAILATPFDGRFAVYGSQGWAEVRDKAHPEDPKGWIFTKHIRGKRKESIEFPPAKAVLANLEAFADAARGRAPYPVPQREMVANVAALEAIFNAARSGKVEEVVN